MDPDVAQLVRDQRLLEAARLASERGDAHDASVIYERACEWRSAAAEALRAGESARALQLALHGGDESTAEHALALLVRDAEAAEAAAAQLARRGQHAWAARVLEGAGREIDAARAWERAGEARRAAGLLERAGAPVDAERVLQTALRREPDASAVAVTLGSLLGRFGKWEAAVRVLQRVPAGAPERREALIQLARALQQLGLTHAASDAVAELESLGEPVTTRSDPDRAAHTAAEPARSHPARLFGRYPVVREAASTPSARVLECEDVVRGEHVAVKIFAAWGAPGSGRAALARFEREVRAMRSVDDPNIVPLRDFVPEGPAIVLAWMAGGTLERMLEARAAFAPARAIEIASAILSALGAAHRLGIVHRDVKPANVLFDRAGGARLSDFGVAHLAEVSATATAGFFGSLAYMSPEQREGHPASVRSDVFATGVILREMLTGERPRPGAAPRLLPSQAHCELDARHDFAVARMTAHDAQCRPVDTFEARAMLAALPWSTVVDVAFAAPLAQHGSNARPSTERLEVRPDGTALDLWTGRMIERIALTDQTLARAHAFALADHTGLQTVWRVDKEMATIWLEELGARMLARPLAREERVLLEEALDALHAAGAVHGRVDPQHVVLGPSGAVLKFDAELDATATADLDRIALARLSNC